MICLNFSHNPALHEQTIFNFPILQNLIYFIRLFSSAIKLPRHLQILPYFFHISRCALLPKFFHLLYTNFPWAGFAATQSQMLCTEINILSNNYILLYLFLIFCEVLRCHVGWLYILYISSAIMSDPNKCYKTNTSFWPSIKLK